jgi:mRNA interferase HigB
MKLISNRALREFAEQHPHAGQALQGWRQVIEKNHFANWAELKKAFNSVDKIRDKTIFDIGGNKYRIIAHVRFEKQILYVKAVLTHEDYAKDDWK